MRMIVNGTQVAFTDEGSGRPLIIAPGFPLRRKA